MLHITITAAIGLLLVAGCAMAQQGAPVPGTERGMTVGAPIITYWAGPGSHNVLDSIRR